MSGGLTSACGEGFVWAGEPLGQETALGGLQVYHASPAAAAPSDGNASSAAAILFIHDVFTWNAKNNRLACDGIARLSGLPVYMPDFFKGDVFTMDDRVGFLARHGPHQTDPLLHSVISGIRAKHGGVRCRIGAVGYCWGGRYVLRLNAQGQLAAGVACHPSIVTPEEDKPEEMQAPVLFLLAEGDAAYEGARREAVEQGMRQSGVEMQVKVFKGVKHGFTVRCDESDAVAVKARDDALQATASWFSDHWNVV